MSALLALPLVAVLAAMAGGRWRRGHGRDVRSIAAHRNTLEVIEHVAAPDEADVHGRPGDPTAAHVRVLPPLEAPPRRRTPRSRLGDDDGEPTELPRLPAYGPRPDRLVFPRARPSVGVDDHQPEPLSARTGSEPLSARTSSEPLSARPGSVPALAPPAARRPRRPSGWSPPALPSLRSSLPSLRSALHIGPDGRGGPTGSRAVRPSVLVPLVAAAAVVVIAGAAVALSGRSGGTPAHRAASPPVSAGPPRSSAPTPTTTVPATEIVATSATSSDATYSVNAAAIDVVLSARGPCWAEVRDGSAAGPIVFEGTLAAGASQSFAADGAIWLRLGDPRAADLSVDGALVALPTIPDPFDVTFVGVT